MNEVEKKINLTNLLDDYYSINFMKMAVLGFEYTSSLVDLLLSPGGSSPLYQTLVPRQFQEESIQEKIDLLENHLVSHGLNSNLSGCCLRLEYAVFNFSPSLVLEI